ncbi:MAG TPA: ATP-binding cassette domain-containing protein [Coprothermobacter proteolyticus]|uniref:ATP-binding transport protein NatA (Na(+) ABC transporter) n=1 Tax=Coprothermobacter proteolyticus (strain ATCC 35245 / DSM 5265 / OCM 4 / BT) TaxID=309798 RepID=B5Y7G8_COPPD|nr:ATP-binding cassette domain-containing protein [Coprothermobacter proteolyticus]MBP8983933.1 ATP-binding cassette domain-containing protein [Coprothermobacter sp.]ACI17287.1 ABC transporter [Coprothermobacter proteolyticus DSM 5265]HOA64675.1 ATP-binding cassette domain-containing protein [Coprothermobacter proteolyticus]HOK24348.1 ATP-binding cassette domain-containing protein [Coprothermobacter proteolyticus]HOP45753.1 ATP-binding cassette domain-containing protein [Coprothermobacter prot
MIEVRELRKSFGQVQALKGISFHCEPGKVTGLLGPNGAGKTTTIRILSTILKPLSGTATVNGFDVVRESDKVRASLGVVLENTGLYRRLSGDENVLYFADLADVPRGEALERMQFLYKLLEIDYGKRQAGTYSKGMAQKINLVRSVIHDPPVLILDEPTAGLDVPSTVAVRTFVEQQKEAGKTVLLSTHLMNEVELLCDYVYIINLGLIVAEGTPEELKKRTQSSNLEEAFMKVVKE